MIRLFKHYIPHAVLLLGLIDLVLLYAAGEVAWQLRAQQLHIDGGSIGGRFGSLLAFALIVQTGMIAVGVYGAEALRSMRYAVARLLVAVSLGIIALSFVDFIFPGLDFWRSTLAYAMFLSIVALIFNRLVIGGILGAGAFRRRVLVLGAGPRAQRLRLLSERPESGFVIVGYVAMHDGQAVVEEAIARGAIHDLTRFVSNLGASEVVLALEERRNALPLKDLLRIKTAEAGKIPLEVLSARWQEQPGNADNVISYVRALLAQGQNARSVSVANSAVRSFPGSVTALTIAGDARLASGQFGAALEVYRRAALVRLTLPLVRRIANAYGRTRQDRAARELTRAYAAQHPLDRDAAILAAQYQAEGGDWKTAGVLALHAASLPGGERDPLAYSLLALSQVELGDPGGGLEDARAAYRLRRWGMAPTMALSEAMGVIKGQEVGAASLRNKLQHFPVLR